MTGKPHEPTLVWYGKQAKPYYARNEIKTVESLNIGQILESVAKNQQVITDFFSGKSKASFAKSFDAYTHKNGWCNRLIEGDSLAAMNLLHGEDDIKDKVQVIYFDPPYGINFKGNWGMGMFFDTPEENSGLDAFADVYDNGIRTYLTEIQKRLIATHSLLADTGSIFVQIGVENMHRIRCLLDEVFGGQNFMWQILFQTAGGGGFGDRPAPYDYILWYAKDKKALKNSDRLHRLYLDYTNEELARKFPFVFLNDGSLRRRKPGEKSGRICGLDRLTSQRSTNEERSAPHTFPNGKTVNPSANVSWRTDGAGLDMLYKKNRIHFNKNGVDWITFPEDAPKIMTNVWTGMYPPTAKTYVVQTNRTVVERCLLMASNPGDLVLDITCGSGVTPYVAEKHGRRWIAVDSMQAPLAITRLLMLESVFPYYRLADKGRGIAGGMIYEEFIKLTAGKIAKDLEEKEYRYEKPLVENGKLRVAGPFIVQKIHKNKTDVKEIDRIKIDTVELKVVSYKYPLAQCVDKAGLRVAVLFGDMIDADFVKNAMVDHADYDTVLIAGFDFDSAAYETMLENRIISAKTSNDVALNGIKVNPDSMLEVTGLVDASCTKTESGQYVASVRGYDCVNPDKTIRHMDMKNICMWMLDTNHDGETFRADQVFLPNRKNRFVMNDQKLVDAKKIKDMTGTESIPFDIGNHTAIAVRVFNKSGIYMTRILRLK